MRFAINDPWRDFVDRSRKELAGAADRLRDGLFTTTSFRGAPPRTSRPTNIEQRERAAAPDTQHNVHKPVSVARGGRRNRDRALSLCDSPI
jgi:hypothetical protein